MFVGSINKHKTKFHGILCISNYIIALEDIIQYVENKPNIDHTNIDHSRSCHLLVFE